MGGDYFRISEKSAQEILRAEGHVPGTQMWQDICVEQKDLLLSTGAKMAHSKEQGWCVYGYKEDKGDTAVYRVLAGGEGEQEPVCFRVYSGSLVSKVLPWKRALHQMWQWTADGRTTGRIIDCRDGKTCATDGN